MKKIIVIIIILSSVFAAQSQNSVLTTKGDLLEGKIESFLGELLIFTKKIDIINSRSIDIDQVLEIHGPIPESRMKSILKKNPNIKFFKQDGAPILSKFQNNQSGTSKYQDPIYFDQKPKIQPAIQQTIPSISNSLVTYDQFAYELSHTRYCLMNYRREKLTGIWLMIGGSTLAATTATIYGAGDVPEEVALIGYVAGGLMGITGEIMLLTCNRWLKKAYFGPADSGIGIKFTF